MQGLHCQISVFDFL